MSLSLFLLSLCVSSAWSIRSAPIYDLEDAEQHFEDFIKTHGKQYADENEKQARFEIFKVNLEKVNRANEGQNITVFGPTYFMDLTLEEFHRSHTGYLRNNASDTSCSPGSIEELHNVDVPDSFDWRDRNAVTPIKNQLKCGSCYAFSTMANIESQYAIKNGQQLDLSEQQLVDCDHGSSGCQGGFLDKSLGYLTDAGGAEGEDNYPYQGTVGQCNFDASKVQVKLSGCRSYNPTSQEIVKQLLYTNGPLSILIQSDGIKTFRGGIVTDATCNVGSVNHAVLLVGYGTDSNGVPVWNVKNSWGTVWGDQGFFSMERGEDKQSCGMMSDGMYSAVL